MNSSIGVMSSIIDEQCVLLPPGTRQKNGRPAQLPPAPQRPPPVPQRNRGASRTSSGPQMNTLKAPRCDKAPLYSVPIDPRFLPSGTSHLSAALDTLSASLGREPNSNLRGGASEAGEPSTPQSANLNSEGASEAAREAAGPGGVLDRATGAFSRAPENVGQSKEVQDLVAHARRLNQPAAALASAQVCAWPLQSSSGSGIAILVITD